MLGAAAGPAASGAAAAPDGSAPAKPGPPAAPAPGPSGPPAAGPGPTAVNGPRAGPVAGNQQPDEGTSWRRASRKVDRVHVSDSASEFSYHHNQHPQHLPPHRQAYMHQRPGPPPSSLEHHSHHAHHGSGGDPAMGAPLGAAGGVSPIATKRHFSQHGSGGGGGYGGAGAGRGPRQHGGGGGGGGGGFRHGGGSQGGSVYGGGGPGAMPHGPGPVYGYNPQMQRGGGGGRPHRGSGSSGSSSDVRSEPNAAAAAAAAMAPGGGLGKSNFLPGHRGPLRGRSGVGGARMGPEYQHHQDGYPPPAGGGGWGRKTWNLSEAAGPGNMWYAGGGGGNRGGGGNSSAGRPESRGGDSTGRAAGPPRPTPPPAPVAEPLARSPLPPFHTPPRTPAFDQHTVALWLQERCSSVFSSEDGVRVMDLTSSAGPPSFNPHVARSQFMQMVFSMLTFGYGHNFGPPLMTAASAHGFPPFMTAVPVGPGPGEALFHSTAGGYPVFFGAPDASAAAATAAGAGGSAGAPSQGPVKSLTEHDAMVAAAGLPVPHGAFAGYQQPLQQFQPYFSHSPHVFRSTVGEPEFDGADAGGGGGQGPKPSRSPSAASSSALMFGNVNSRTTLPTGAGVALPGGGVPHGPNRQQLPPFGRFNSKDSSGRGGGGGVGGGTPGGGGYPSYPGDPNNHHHRNSFRRGGGATPGDRGPGQVDYGPGPTERGPGEPPRNNSGSPGTHMATAVGAI